VTSGYRLFRRNRPDVIIVDLGVRAFSNIIHVCFVRESTCSMSAEALP